VVLLNLANHDRGFPLSFITMPNDPDHAAALRSLYAADGGPRAVFTQRAADYAASRPDYPAALFETLREICPPAGGTTVADIGAGTGLLTEGLLRRGYLVVAVEPNAAMRQVADGLLGRIDGYRSVDGGAEAMPLADGSIDLITAAQAFHWFEVDRARAEFLRVLTAQGRVALIWNDRMLEDPLHAALDEVFVAFGGTKLVALAACEDRSNVARFFGSSRAREFVWPHVQRLDEAGLSSLVFSRSYVPGRATDDGRRVADRVREVFGRFAVNSQVEVRYRTVAIVGRPAA
jgi:SAM-dependent methyltransferase